MRLKPWMNKKLILRTRSLALLYVMLNDINDFYVDVTVLQVVKGGVSHNGIETNKRLLLPREEISSLEGKDGDVYEVPCRKQGSDCGDGNGQLK